MRRFASLLDGLYESWLDDPVSRPIADRDLADGQHRNPDPVDRPGSFTTADFHTPAGPAAEADAAGFARSWSPIPREATTSGIRMQLPGLPGRPVNQRRERLLCLGQLLEEIEDERVSLVRPFQRDEVRSTGDFNVAGAR